MTDVRGGRRRAGLAALVVAATVAVAGAEAPGDADCDGTVNGDDLAALVVAAFGDSQAECVAADVNGDGRVSSADMVALTQLLTQPAIGPRVTFFGLATPSGLAIGPLGDANGTPVFYRGAGSGFQIIVEGRSGRSGQPVGLTAYNPDARDPSQRPDVQIESSTPLGDGSRAVCEGGIPAIEPPDFGPTQRVADALNDIGCHIALASLGACTQDEFGRPAFLGSGSQAQFCLLLSRAMAFPVGDTVLSVRLRDTGGDLGPLQRMIVRVGSGPAPLTFTPSPIASSTPTPTPTATATPPPSLTPSSTRTATSGIATRTPTRSATVTAGIATRTPTATPTRTATRTVTSSPPPSDRSATSSPTGTRTATRTPPPTASPTRTDTSTATPPPTPSRTRTTTRAVATRTPTPTRTASASPSPTPTPTRTATPPSPAAATATRTRTTTRTATPSRTPAAGPIGPVITFFGMTRADDTLVDPIGTNADGLPIYTRAAGAGFSLVIEGKAGPSGAAVGPLAFQPDLRSLPDLQVEVSRPLGDGSPAVCDRVAPAAGGVPAIDPPNFDTTPDTINIVNDLACRFLDGSGQPRGRGANAACVLFPSGNFEFADRTSTTQFCGFIDAIAHFPSGDTIVTVRLRDVEGNVGAPMQIVIRVGS